MIYLDNNATTAVDPRILPAMDAVLRSGPLNPSSQHRVGQRARRALDDALDQIAATLDCDLSRVDSPRLIVTSGGTEANNLAIRAIGEPDAAIITSQIEHPSVLAVAQAARATGRPTATIRVGASGVVDLSHLDELLNHHSARPGVAVVSIMSANNETGVVQPIAAAGAICQRHGVPLHVDATQSIGKVPLDWLGSGVAAMTITPHKFHGPAGVGFLWHRGGLDLHGGFDGGGLLGGEQQLGVRPGTEPVALVVGAAMAMRLAVDERPAAAVAMAAQRDRLESELLAAWPAAIVHGRDANRLPSTSCVSFVGHDRQALLISLDLAGIACSSGSACRSGSSPPSHVLAAMGADPDAVRSALRFGLSKFSTDEEIDQAIALISKQIRRKNSFQPVEN